MIKTFINFRNSISIPKETKLQCQTTILVKFMLKKTKIEIVF